MAGKPLLTEVAPPAGWAPSWLTSGLSGAIVSALGAGAVWFVGGAVRDSLLGRPVADIDMATSHEPQAVQRLLNVAGIKTIATGIKHGTVTAISGKDSREITTLRQDVSTDGRHAVVAFTDDVTEDAARRDFTINALYVTPDGRLLDPFDGYADLLDGRVRFIGNATDRIREDALRIMRFYRFSARFSDDIDETGQAACTSLVSMLNRLSVERVRDEFLKLLELESPKTALLAMGKAGVFDWIFRNGHDLKTLTGQLDRERHLPEQSLPLSRLWLVVRGFYSQQEIARFLRLSRRQLTFLNELECLLADGEPINIAHVPALLYRASREVLIQAVLILSEPDRVRDLLAASREMPVPVFPVKGQDLAAVGMNAGPEMGERLAAMEQRWIDSAFTLSKEDLIGSL